MKFANPRRLLLTAALILPGTAVGQVTPVILPTPAPTRAPTTVLPGVTPERFTLGTPTPAPAPVVAPTPVPTPSPTVAAPRPSPAARSTPTDLPAPRLTPAPVPTPTPTSVPEPVIPPTPVAVPTPATESSPVPASGRETPAWLWVFAGAGATALLFGIGLAFSRRRRASEEMVEPTFAPEPAAPPSPRVPARPAPSPAPTPAPASEPFEVALRPLRIQLNAQDVLIEVELLLGNLQASAAENIKVDLAMISASPDQDEILAGYHTSLLLEAAAEPFDLPSRAGQQLAATLALPRDRIHVVEVGGRPMFVPLVMIDVRWRAGISLRRFGADFMVGTAGQGDKLGPIWLDRPAPAGALAATRYRPRA